MTRDLVPRMRRLLVERTGHDYVSVTHAHLTELVDRCEAAEAFGAACIESSAISKVCTHNVPMTVRCVRCDEIGGIRQPRGAE